MKDNSQNQNQSSRRDKKKKVKIHCNVDNECKCFATTPRHHHYGCPLVRKPCPIHGGQLCFSIKEETLGKEMDDCVLISFHPSLKTDKLFRPVKSLLSRRCSPEAKINFQYYSPADTKDTFKHRQIQTNAEDLIRGSCFVEKTKNFMSDKTNRMKKLKQCFHSPCNSIAPKSLSQTSVIDKLNEVFWEDKKKTHDVSVSVDFFEEKFSREKKSDYVNTDPSLGWFRCKRLGSSDDEKSSIKMLSDIDFINLPFKNNFLNPQVYRMKDKKNMKDIYESMRKSTASTIPHSLNLSENRVSNEEDNSVYSVDEAAKPKKEKKKKKEPKRNSEGYSDSDSGSSESVYFTPFFLIPGDMQHEPEEVKPEDAEDKKDSVSKSNTDVVPTHADKSTQLDNISSKKPSVSSEKSELSQKKESDSIQSKRDSLPKNDKSVQTDKIPPKKESLATSQTDKKLSLSSEKDELSQKKKTDSVKSKHDSLPKKDKSVQTDKISPKKESLVTSQTEKKPSKESLSKEQEDIDENNEPKIKTKEAHTQTSVLGVDSENNKKNIPKINETRSQSSQTEEKRHFVDVEVDATVQIKIDDPRNVDLDKVTLKWKSFSDGALIEKKRCECGNMDNDMTVQNCYCPHESSNSSDENDSDNKKSPMPRNISKSAVKNSSISENKARMVDETTSMSSVQTKDEGMNSSLSDLSELIKIINENFGQLTKMFFHKPADKCLVDNETMTDFIECFTFTSTLSATEIEKKFVNVGTQTDNKPNPTTETSLMPNSFSLDKANKVTFLCEICAAKTNHAVKDACTLTDSMSAAKLDIVTNAGTDCELIKSVTFCSNVSKHSTNSKKPTTSPRKSVVNNNGKVVPKRPTCPPPRPTPTQSKPKPIERRFSKNTSCPPTQTVNVTLKTGITKRSCPPSTQRTINIVRQAPKPTVQRKPGVSPSESTRTSPRPGPSIPSCLTGGICDCPDTDIYPSLPVKPWPGEKPKPPAKPKPRPSPTYSVTIPFSWPDDITSLNTSILESEKPSIKRNFEKEMDDDIFPIEKKIKSETFEKHNIFNFLQKPEVVSCSTDSKLFVKKIRSSSPPKKGASCCLFTCKHEEDDWLKNDQFRLYKCEYCKSLTYLNPNKTRFRDKMISLKSLQVRENHLTYTDNDRIFHLSDSEPTRQNSRTSTNYENFVAEYPTFTKLASSSIVSEEGTEEDSRTQEFCKETASDVETITFLSPTGFSYQQLRELGSTSKAFRTFWFRGENDSYILSGEENESENEETEYLKESSEDK